MICQLYTPVNMGTVEVCPYRVQRNKVQRTKASNCGLIPAARLSIRRFRVA